MWVRDAKAANWDGSTGNWWDEGNTDQKIVDAMMSATIQGLTGESSDAQAWDALFRHFNKTRGFGDAGYQKPEKIAIKLNMNQDRPRDWKPDAGMPSPQVGLLARAAAHQDRGRARLGDHDLRRLAVRRRPHLQQDPRQSRSRVPERHVRRLAQERRQRSHRRRPRHRQPAPDQGRHGCTCPRA